MSEELVNEEELQEEEEIQEEDVFSEDEEIQEKAKVKEGELPPALQKAIDAKKKEIIQIEKIQLLLMSIGK